MIEIAGVSHCFGSRVVLDDVSFRVEPGSLVGLVGPNGAGKTTLLRAIATLLRLRQGNIRVAGADVRADPVLVRERLGYLPERDLPYGDLTSSEYLECFAEIAGLFGAQRNQRIERALSEAELLSRRDELVGRLSKGLKQRLVLQSILLHRPRVLVLDEPTDGLDPQSRDRICRQLRELADGGCAVLVSSHVLEELERVADWTLALVEGKALELRGSTRRRFVLRVRGDLAVARLVALGTPAAAEVNLKGEQLLVELGSGIADPAEVVSALVQAGVPVVTVAEEPNQLREAYDRAVSGGGT